MIRGKKVEQALAELEFSRKRIAGDVQKVPDERDRQRREQSQLDVNDLVVAEAWTSARTW